jgi:hypothetical protein
VGRPKKDIEKIMSKTIAKRNHEFVERPRHHFILHPVDMRIFIDVAPDMGGGAMGGLTKAHVQLTISEISVSFEDRQFREIVSLGTNIGAFAKLEAFSAYRPQASDFSDFHHAAAVAGVSARGSNDHGGSSSSGSGSGSGGCRERLGKEGGCGSSSSSMNSASGGVPTITRANAAQWWR